MHDYGLVRSQMTPSGTSAHVQAGTPKFPTQTLLLYFGTEQRITLTIWHRNLNHTRPAVDTAVDSGSQKVSKGAA